MRTLDLVLIRGLPGSGKTTLAHNLLSAATYTLYHAEADHFFYEEGANYNYAYNFDRRLLGAAHDWCYGNAMHALKQGMPVIVSNTFSTRREIDRYVEGVKRSGMDVKVHVVKCAGEYRNTHNVPKSALKRMKDRWEDYPGEVEAA